MAHRKRETMSALSLLKGRERLSALQAVGVCKREVFSTLWRLEIWQQKGQRMRLRVQEGLWIE